MKYLLVICLCGVFACSDGKNISPEITSETQELNGSWVANCYQSFDIPEPIWSIPEYHITDNEISHVYTNYADSGCTVLYSGAENLWEGYDGTYIRLNNILTTSGVEAAWLEVTSTVISPNDLMIEIGLYRNEDSLFNVIEGEGLYHIAQLEYYRQ